ncbi:MAG: phospho-N-acetylmuramoyl-pentapeptide-transferase [Clostridia bacterium]|nr:phospho-N-acetylmuramoyl-pentapeptide-transferase [Clostridia bacterium]
MNIYVKYSLVIIVAFFVTMAVAYPIIALMKRLKAGQPILSYVDKHEGKSGTPTMGGLMFLIGMTITSAAFGAMSFTLGAVAVAVTLCYGLIGFLDDFIKVRTKHNQGLKAYQKVIGQAGVAIILTIFCYRNPYVGTSIALPFTNVTLDLGWGYIPFCFILFIAMTNAVNLTDGLDGLVAKTSTTGFIALSLILVYLLASVADESNTAYRQQLDSVAVFAFAMIGALLAFIWFNSNPAKIFMGDTGSLSIGGALAVITVFIKNPFINLLIGIMYVVSCISVIVQVLVYKAKGKRVFLMAPYHHHLEYKGIKESKIVTYYTLITAIGGIIAVISVIV